MKPAGFPKAWPTKPRSVSQWPGLAGLQPCGLSAGRPGRLRTLTAQWVDCSMSSLLKLAISEAWISVQRAECSSGLDAVMSVAGALTGTESAEGGNARGDFGCVGVPLGRIT